MKNDPIVIVGAGLGGLAAALRLAHLGERVIVLEKTDQVGGRNRAVRVGECDFDGGPTLMMMLEPFQTLFREVGERMEDHLKIRLCDPSYRAFFRDGTRLDATANVAQMLRQIEAIAPQDAAAYPQLIGELAALYEASIPNFVRRNFYHAGQFFAPPNLARVAKHHMISNLAKRIEKKFQDPRLRMLFSFQTMYLGLSPYDAPWVYATLTYMEYGDGIWYPEGGLPAISQAVAKLAEARGAEIRLGEPVCEVQGNEVLLESGERIKAKAVLANADLPYAERALAKRPVKARRFSCSAYVLYLDYEGELPGMEHHNVFFGQDFKGNLDAIFHRYERPDDPAFYACISKQSEPGRAPAGHENLFLLIPCANLNRTWNDEEAAALEATVYRRLSEEAGFDPSRIRARGQMTPVDWRDQLNLEHGAAFGLSHDFWQSAFFRPSNKSRFNPHLYYVGASTTPGNGLPMVLISAELAVDRLRHDGLVGA